MAEPKKYPIIWEYHQNDESVYILGHQANDGFFEVHVIRGKNGVNFQRLAFVRVYHDETETKQLRFNRKHISEITQILKEAILAQYEDGISFIDKLVALGDPYVIEHSLVLAREDKDFKEALNAQKHNPYEKFIEGLDLDELAD